MFPTARGGGGCRDKGKHKKRASRHDFYEEKPKPNDYLRERRKRKRRGTWSITTATISNRSINLAVDGKEKGGKVKHQKGINRESPKRRFQKKNVNWGKKVTLKGKHSEK